MKLLLLLILLCSLNVFSQKKEIGSSQNTFKDSLQNKRFSFQDSLSYSKKSILLDEVKIRSNSQITAYSLGITKKPIIAPTQYERQLLTAGDFKPIHLLSLLGGSLQVDPIINAISGRTKRLKKYVKIERNIKYHAYLKENFEEFFTEKLKIDQELFGSFIIHLSEDENIQNLIQNKKFDELEFAIADKWFIFKDRQFENSPEEEPDSD